MKFLWPRDSDCESNSKVNPSYLVFATKKGKIYAFDQQKKQNTVSVLADQLGIIDEITFDYENSLMFVVSRPTNTSTEGRVSAYRYKVTHGREDQQVHFTLANNLQKVTVYSGGIVTAVVADPRHKTLYVADATQQKIRAVEYKKLAKLANHGFSEV